MKKATVLEVLKSFDEDVILEKLIDRLLSVKKDEAGSYDPEFVAMVLKCDEDLNAGKGVNIDPQKL